MADDERGPEAPSLEPPTLSFRRKRRRSSPAADPETSATTADPVDDRPTQALPPSRAGGATPVEPRRPVPVDEPAAAVEPTFEDTAPPLFVDQVRPPVPAPPAPAGEAPEAAHTERHPRVTGMPAVVLAGLVVGLLAVALTAVSLRACEAVQGTSSCGGPGLLLLLAILVVMILVGSALLRRCHVPDPGSTSFLAVGLVAVVSLLFLVDHLLEWWMVAVVPLVSVAAYAASHWVTTSVIEPARE